MPPGAVPEVPLPITTEDSADDLRQRQCFTRQDLCDTQRICAAAGRLDISVLRVIARPVLVPPELAASARGVDGLGDIGLPQPDRLPDTEMRAVDFILQQARKYPSEVVLCPIGPITNVAVALLLDPSLAQNLHSIAFMDGAAYCVGNMNDHAEFNFMADPTASSSPRLIRKGCLLSYSRGRRTRGSLTFVVARECVSQIVMQIVQQACPSNGVSMINTNINQYLIAQW